jgi:hypothetical protein
VLAAVREQAHMGIVALVIDSIDATAHLGRFLPRLGPFTIFGTAFFLLIQQPGTPVREFVAIFLSKTVRMVRLPKLSA